MFLHLLVIILKRAPFGQSPYVGIFVGTFLSPAVWRLGLRRGPRVSASVVALLGFRRLLVLLVAALNGIVHDELSGSVVPDGSNRRGRRKFNRDTCFKTAWT